MAASNAPKNDFAPAWLKIPNPNENVRPAGSKVSHTPDRPRQRREDNSYGRYGNDYPRPLNRQNSCDVYDGTKRHSPSHSSKHRHHSVEDDYYYSSYSSYGYPYPYPYNDQYSMLFGSQPSMQRRDGKFPSPAPARFGQMNGSYQSYNYYYDFFPPGEGFNSYGGGGGHGSSKRSLYARDGRGESKESRDSDRSGPDGEEKDRIFNDDFPSLNGADEEGDAKTSKHTSSGGVWDNPPRSRFEEVSDVKNSASGLYKVVPSKSGSMRKDSREGVRLNGSVRDVSPLASVKANTSRERQSPTQPMEILSSQLVRPKPSDKKSQFLKALRREADTESSTTHNGHSQQPESNNNVCKGEDEAEEVVMNGVHDLQLDHDMDQPSSSSKILSSSMEKEFSFMRSLGWNPNETDETEEITEDEKREFQKLTDKLQQEQQKNGRARLLPKSWSPQHMAPYTPPQPDHDVNETLSSSDTSDEDV